MYLFSLRVLLLTDKPGITLIILHRQTEKVFLETTNWIRLRLDRQCAFHLLMTHGEHVAYT